MALLKVIWEFSLNFDRSLPAAGVSISAVGLEVLRYAIMWMYNVCFGYSLISYMEYPLLLVQQTILFYFVLKFNQLISVEIALFSLLLVITMLLFMTEMLPRVILAFLIVSIRHLHLFVVHRSIRWIYKWISHFRAAILCAHSCHQSYHSTRWNITNTECGQHKLDQLVHDHLFWNR